jgi:NAD+ kinase
MKILLLYKKSVYKYVFLNPANRDALQGTDPRFLKRFQRTHAQHTQALAKVEEVLKKFRLSYVKYSRGREISYDPYDVVITLGGDGTFLEAARHIRHQIILGINSDPHWSVGRFCVATDKNFETYIRLIIENRHRTQQLQRLCLTVPDSHRQINVLNDILVCHKNPAAMSRYIMTVKGKMEEQRSSGVWVAPAAGSTGAIQSAGGIVLPMESKRFQYMVREPYYRLGDKFILTGGMLSSHDKIQFLSLMPEGIIYVDGPHEFYPFKFGHKVTITRSTQPLKVVRSI